MKSVATMMILMVVMMMMVTKKLHDNLHIGTPKKTLSLIG
jgi:hypothetical protein